MATINPFYLFEDVDDESAVLMLEIQIADLREAERTFRGSGPTGRPLDNELALREQRRILEAALNSLRDRQVARAVALRESRMTRAPEVQVARIPNPPRPIRVPRRIDPQAPIIRLARQHGQERPQPLIAQPVTPEDPPIQMTSQLIQHPAAVEITLAPDSGSASSSQFIEVSQIVSTTATSQAAASTSESIISPDTGDSATKATHPTTSISTTTSADRSNVNPISANPASGAAESLVRQATPITSQSEFSLAQRVNLSDEATRNAVAVWENENTPSSKSVDTSFMLSSDDSSDSEEVVATDLHVIDKGKQKATRSCTACSEILYQDESATLPCEHEWCQSCVRELFERACQSETNYPPQCCPSKPLELDGFQVHLEPEIVTLFQEKVAEYETPAPRHYCSKRDCNSFLRTSDITAHRGVCRKCATVTCTMCDSVWHPNGECPSDADLKKVLKLAKINRWPRCHNCNAILTRESGCDYVTCSFCKSGNCAQCGAKCRHTIKTCRCLPSIFIEGDNANEILDLDVYDALDDTAKAARETNAAMINQAAEEARTRERAEEAERQAEWARVRAERARRAREAAEAEAGRLALLNFDFEPPTLPIPQAECTHPRDWEYTPGRGGLCLVCNWHMSTFVMQCPDCLAVQCRRCCP